MVTADNAERSWMICTATPVVPQSRAPALTWIKPARDTWVDVNMDICCESPDR